MTIILDINSGYRPELFRVVAQYDGPLSCAENKVAHPVSMLSPGWGKMVRRLTAFLDNMDAMKAYRSEIKADKSPDDLYADKVASVLHSYEDFLYSAVELVETIADELPKCFLPMPKHMSLRSSRVKGLRKHADQICNKLKHNQHVLVGVGFSNPQGRVEGYSVYHSTFDSTGNYVHGPNRHIHEHLEAFSFNVDLCRVLASLFLISREISDSIRKLGHPIKEIQEEPNNDWAHLAERVSLISEVGFPLEATRPIPLWSLKDGELRIDERGGRLRRWLLGGTITMRMSGDGHTKSFHLLKV